jgi:hypothetical protein
VPENAEPAQRQTFPSINSAGAAAPPQPVLWLQLMLYCASPYTILFFLTQTNKERNNKLNL